jgi:hypothetical protein
MGHRLIQVHLKLLPAVIYTLLRFPLILLLLLILFNTLPATHQLVLGWGGGFKSPPTLFSHLHLTLNKYFPGSSILFTFVQQIIFLYTKSSFIFGQLLFVHSSLHFLDSLHINNMCFTSSSAQRRGHLPFSKPLLIHFNYDVKCYAVFA